MRVRLPRHERGVYPAWPFVGIGLIILGLIGIIVDFIPARFIPPCGFHMLTGHPCPTCGVTRMGLDLIRLHPERAFFMQPFFFLVVAALVLWVGAGLVARFFGRDLFLSFGRREEKIFWVLMVAAFLLNWAYLWHAGI
ncbi:MAG: DUF2752 domain-containing protein [Acidobacteriota bacterium]|jgi:hypothetical protein